MHSTQTKNNALTELSLATSVLIIGCVFFVSISRAQSCPAGTTPITDRAAATAAGIPTSAQCWNASDPNVGQTAGAAKEWLKQHAVTSANISCMNTAFAERLKNFMQAVPGGIPVITDGYRDPGKQAALVASGASKAGYCQSYHNYGLAADFNNNSSAQTAWMRANSQNYGVGHIGGWDPNHFQISGGLSGQCGSCSNTSGNGALPNNAGASQSPTSALTRAICSLTNTCPQQQQAQPQPSSPSQPQQQQAQQPQQQTSCAVGYVLGGICYLSPQTTTSPTSTQPLNTNLLTTNTPATSTATSSSNFIDYYANLGLSTTTTHATNTPLVLNSNVVDITNLVATTAPVIYAYATNDGVNPDGSSTGNSDNTSSNVISTNQPTTTVSGGQTFTSQDMTDAPSSNSGDSYTFTSSNTTFLARVLENLKQILLNILSFLKPFGGATPAAQQLE